MDFPAQLAGPPFLVGGTAGQKPIIAALRIAPANGAWPTANTAIYVPFHVFAPTLVAQLAWINGSTLSGNADCGIYDAVGTRLVSTGSTAQAGASLPQVVNVTDITLGAGLFYMGLALDNTTGTLLGIVPTLQRGRVIGLVEQASAFPLPATAAFATLTNNFLPYNGFTSKVTL